MKILLLPLAFVLALQPDAVGPGDYARKVKQGKYERSYVFHVPKSYDARKPTPLVLVLHGATMDADAMVYLSGLNDKSEQAGFIAVYPNGLLATLNAGGQKSNMADDVGFIGTGLDGLEKQLRVDNKRDD